MSRARVICTGMILALLPLVIVGCQLGSGVQPAATPRPPPPPPFLPAPPPTPTLEERKVQTGLEIGNNTKVIDGYLHVWYIPCGNLPATWVAPLSVTDLYSHSKIYLNRDGTVKSSPKPDYKSEEGRARLEAALKDSSVMEQVLTFPECPEPDWLVSEPGFCGGLDGWPDPEEENIGEPPMPKVGLSRDDPTRGTCMGNGWTGSYCWPTGTEGRTCEEREDWNELTGVETYGIIKGPRPAHITVLGDEANPGRVSRIRMFMIQDERSLLKLGTVATPGEEAYSLNAQEGETIAQFAKPDIPEGVYLLIASYESPLGEVEYGFKVKLMERRVRE